MKCASLRRAVVTGIGCVTALAAPAVMQAQSPPPTVVFLPGLNEAYPVWSSSASTLQSMFNISTYTAPLNTLASVPAQSSSLGSVGNGGYLVGHSLGGLVARHYAQTHSLGGLVTLGTPNYGAPLIENIWTFCGFIGGTGADIWWLGSAIFSWLSGSWVFDALGEDNYQWITLLIGSVCEGIVNEQGLAGSTANQLELGADNSSFLSDTMNSTAAITAETNHAGPEVTVAVTTDNFYDAGPFKAWMPDGAGEAWGHALQDLGFEIEFLGFEVELVSDPDDFLAQNVAQRLFAVANDIAFVDEAWCESVSGSLFHCDANDEVVPGFSQVFVLRGHEIDVTGPVHTREAQEGATLLPSAFDALGLTRR